MPNKVCHNNLYVNTFLLKTILLYDVKQLQLYYSFEEFFFIVCFMYVKQTTGRKSGKLSEQKISLEILWKWYGMGNGMESKSLRFLWAW